MYIFMHMMHACIAMSSGQIIPAIVIDKRADKSSSNTHCTELEKELLGYDIILWIMALSSRILTNKKVTEKIKVLSTLRNALWQNLEM